MKQSLSIGQFARRMLAMAVIAVAVAFTARAEVKIGELYYALDDAARTAAVVNSTEYGTLTDVDIPASVTSGGFTYSVTTLAEEAFANASAMKSITIPASVTQILDRAFNGCTALQNVTFSDGDTPIALGVKSYGEFGPSYSILRGGAGLFNDCSLESLYIGRTIENLKNSYEVYYQGTTVIWQTFFGDTPRWWGYSPFYGQTKLTSVTLGAGCKNIQSYLFYQLSSITIMRLAAVEVVGTHAFDGCSRLSTLSFGNALTTIGDVAFMGCANLTLLEFPATLTSIGNEAFKGCSSVTRLDFATGCGLKSIGAYAFQDCRSFTASRLPETVETIGVSAFDGCTKLTYVDLGKSLKKVSDATFRNCPALSEMVVPEGVTEIGTRAFYNCTGIATYTLPESLESIGAEVFYNNSGLPSLSIPGKVTSMGQNCFYGCTRLSFLTFRDGTGSLVIDNSSSKSCKIPVVTPYRENCEYDYFFDCPLRTVYIGRDLEFQFSNQVGIYNPDKKEVVKRESAPFAYKASIAKVTIGPKVTSLWDYLLVACTGIKEVVMPDGLTTVKTYVFSKCSGLTDLTFPGTLTSLGDYSVNLCSNLANVRFNDGTETLYAGRGCSQGNFLFGDSPLQSLYIGKNILYNTSEKEGQKGNISPFRNQRQLTDVRFSQAGTVTLVHDNLLWGCTVVPSLKLPESLETIGESAFRELRLLGGIVVPDRVTSIGGYAFYNCDELVSAKLSVNIDKVNECTFGFCPKLEGIVIPDKVTDIKYSAFQDCGSLKSATLGKGLKRIHNAVFIRCSSLSEISVPSNVVNIADSVFNACTSLARVTLIDGTDNLTLGVNEPPAYEAGTGKGLFRDCPVETLHLGRWIIYDDRSDATSPFAHITAMKNLTIGESCGIIGKYGFTGCTQLNPLYVPDCVESIGVQAFKDCTSLDNVRLSEKLKSLGDEAFMNCTSLPEITLPESLLAISDGTFTGCSALKTADMGSRLETIGPRAFKDCSSLEEAVIPATVYGLGVESFRNCVKLPYAVIPKGLSNVGSMSFQGCASLGWVSLSSRVSSIGDQAFADCPNVKYIKSFNTVPPEGLTGFSEDIEKNATLFIPEESTDMYQYSYTWENFLNLRPLTDDLLVTSVTLDKAEASLRDTETVQLTATVGSEEATNRGLIWKSSDEDVAAVDADGLVTALAKVGTAVISATAADGSGVKAECRVTVEPTLVSAITLDKTEVSLKAEKTAMLSATVAPATTTDKSLVWTSSDERVATVDANGEVTAVYDGTATIKATAADGSGVVAECTVTVRPPVTGDSNDDDRVSVSDAVNTVNYIVGNTPKVFNRRAADVDANGSINVADASATVQIALGQPLASAPSMAVASDDNAAAAIDSDRLVVSDMRLSAGEEASIEVKLDNAIDYTALQADILLPEGVELDDVELGSRAAGHTVMSREVAPGVVRVAVFSIGNETFADSDDALLTLNVKARKDFNGGMLNMANVFASDMDAQEYRLEAIGGHIGGASGIGAVNGDTVSLVAVDGGIEVSGAQGATVSVYSLDGVNVDRFKVTSDKVFRALASGFYVISVDGYNAKILVK